MGLFKTVVGGAIGFAVGGPAGAAIGAGLGGAMDASKQQAQAAQAAAGTQAAAASEGVAEQRRQFDKLVELMSPYVGAGRAATAEQLALLGFEEVPVEEAIAQEADAAAKFPNSGAFSRPGGLLSSIISQVQTGGGDAAKTTKTTKTTGTKIVASPDAQKRAIAALEQSPFFTSMMQQGENALLQSASATGGLRGGNIQGALAQFRPGLLNQMIQQRMANLGGLTQIGQASAAGQAAQGMQSAGAIGNLLAQQGAAIAGGQLAQGQQMQNTLKTIGGLAGIAGGLGWNPFGATSQPKR